MLLTGVRWERSFGATARLVRDLYVLMNNYDRLITQVTRTDRDRKYGRTLESLSTEINEGLSRFSVTSANSTWRFNNLEVELNVRSFTRHNRECGWKSRILGGLGECLKRIIQFQYLGQTENDPHQIPSVILDRQEFVLSHDSPDKVLG